MKKLIVSGLIGLIIVFAVSCGEANTNSGIKVPSGDEGTKTENADPSYDKNKGAGKFTNVEIGASLDVAMAAKGFKVFGVKCQGCHKLTDEKLVGPGWQGVTSRNTAEWIMNFVTNTDEMLNKDPKAKAQLEVCLVRMPNQNIQDEEARALYEFMRQNDGVK